MFFYQLKNELWKLFGKKRTYIGFSMLMLAQLLIILLLRFYPPAHRGLARSIEASGFMGEQYISMLTVATIMAFVLAYTLLPLYVALVFASLVSVLPKYSTCCGDIGSGIMKYRETARKCFSPE